MITVLAVCCALLGFLIALRWWHPMTTVLRPATSRLAALHRWYIDQLTRPAAWLVDNVPPFRQAADRCIDLLVRILPKTHPKE